MNNTNKNNTVTFYILQEDLSTMHKNMLTDTAIMNNCNIEFLQIMDPSMDELFVSAQLSKAAYYRLEMVKLLPDIVKKIIYLDCDLLVFKDIETLWSIDMENKPLAAVADLGIMASSKDAKKKEQSLGIKVGEPYFNSGMLIVDVEKWREANYADLVKEAAISHDYQHHDQDALNGVFYGNHAQTLIGVSLHGRENILKGIAIDGINGLWSVKPSCGNFVKTSSISLYGNLCHCLVSFWSL